MESGLMMTIEQLQKNLKSIDDRLEVNKVTETRIVYNNLHQPMQENKGELYLDVYTKELNKCYKLEAGV